MLRPYFARQDRKSTRLNSSHSQISYAVFCLKKKTTTIVTTNYVASDTAVVAIMSLAFFAQGMAALGWTLVSDIAPAWLLGVAGGIFNFAANLAGIITPLVIGGIVGATGSFVDALFFIGFLALLGALSYVFVVDDVRRIPL